MKSHQVCRLPVVDGHDLVGIVSLTDLAKNLEDDRLGDLVVGSLRVPARGAFRRCPPFRLSGRDATEFWGQLRPTCYRLEAA